MKKNIKVFAALAGLAVVIALFAGIYTLTRPQVQQGSKAITVEVVHGDGSAKEFSYQTDEEYLGTLLQEDGLIEGNMGQFGLYITVVDGESAIYEEDASYWSFYHNGAYASQGVDQTPIADGDRFSFVYTVG